MKKILVAVLVMTGMVIVAQQFVIKKDVEHSVRSIKPKELLNNLIDLERRIPSLLRKSAELLEVLHDHIEACVDGNKNAYTKKKDAQAKELCKERITKLNDAITNVESSISQLVDILSINKMVNHAKGC